MEDVTMFELIWHWPWGDDDEGTMNVISVSASVNFRTNFSPLNTPPPLSPNTAGNSGGPKKISQFLGVTSGEPLLSNPWAHLDCWSCPHPPDVDLPLPADQETTESPGSEMEHYTWTLRSSWSTDRQVRQTGETGVHDLSSLQTGERDVYDLSRCPLSCSHVEDKDWVTGSGWHLVQTSQILWESWKSQVQSH